MPADALAARLRRRLPSAVRLRLAWEAVGGLSRGTVLGLVSDFRRPGVRRRGGELVTARGAEETLRIDLGGGLRRAATNPWRGDAVTAWWSGVYSDIDAYTVFPAPLYWLLRSRRLPPFWAVAGSGPAQGLLGWLARWLPDGPGEQRLEAGLTRIWAQAEDAAGSRVTARLRGPHVYLFTAGVALWLARRILEGRLRVGFQTPATALGPDLLDRLAEEVEGLEITAA